jgi:hypothetical protein
MLKRTVSVLAIAAVIATAFAPAAFAADDIIKVKRDVVISKDMTVKDVVVIYGSVTSYGKAEGSVVAIGGSVYLKENASVKEDVIAVGGVVEKSPGVTVGGNTTQIDVPRFLPFATAMLAGGWLAAWAAISVLVLLGFLGLAVLAMALLPEHMARVAGALDASFAKSLLWGLFWVLMVVPVAALLAISIVGIVLIPLEVLLVALAFIIGYIAAAIYIGKKVFAALKKAPPPFIDAVCGIAILFAVSWVPVLGAALKAVFIIAGFGAVVTTRFGTVARDKAS